MYLERRKVVLNPPDHPFSWPPEIREFRKPLPQTLVGLISSRKVLFRQLERLLLSHTQTFIRSLSYPFSKSLPPPSLWCGKVYTLGALFFKHVTHLCSKCYHCVKKNPPLCSSSSFDFQSHSSELHVITEWTEQPGLTFWWRCNTGL